MEMRKPKKIRRGQVFTDKDLKEIFDALPNSSPVKQKQLPLIDDELPADPWDWSAQWLYMYLEQIAIYEMDYGMEHKKAKEWAEKFTRGEYKDDRELGMILDVIVDWESFLPPKVRKKYMVRRKKKKGSCNNKNFDAED